MVGSGDDHDGRRLVVDLAEPGEPSRCPGADTVRVEGPRQWLTFAAESSAAPLVSDVASRYKIADLSILESNIEDVI